ncbi:MAG: M23 family metallopeptidase [Anaerolineales bacterium]|nr:M23 family metallopeptidase [Anaerolineales bacterium]
MAEKHIILLPKADYWDWVRAARRYVLRFGVNLTPDPVTAARYLYPGQTVTVVNAPGGYPNQGNIVQWFGYYYPEANLDVVEVTNVAGLEEIFELRIQHGDRYGTQTPATGTFRLRWPTDYADVSQPFGVHPEVYNQYGLPGHEGVDIRAPMGANVYACADGEVYRVHDSGEGDAYGRHIRIRHKEGYRTVYAHLMRVFVSEGQHVIAGQRIGAADSTGQSEGSHLHLTLKKDGATAANLTHFPRDIIDPTPFLLFPGQEDANRPVEVYPWSPGRCLVGLNARDDGTFTQADFDVVAQARLEAVKIEENTTIQDINRLKQVNSALFIMARLHYILPQEKVEPAAWLARIQPDMQRLYQVGIRYFEVHKSPNLQSEGWNTSWHSGGGFGRWWLDVCNALRDRFPDAKLGFPGISPGGQIDGWRLDAGVFLEQADEAIMSADWVGVNCYWSSDQEMGAERGGGYYRFMRRRYPEKLLFLTEFSNVNELENLRVKGRQYVDYYQQIKDYPGVGAAFANVMSSRNAYGKQRWRREDGTLTHVVGEVGDRDF